MTLADLPLDGLAFRTSADVFEPMRAACASNPDLATFETIGVSEEGRPIAGVTLGHGPRLVTLIAGAHADEPVGPETLRTLVLEGLAARGWGAEGGGLADLFERVTLRIVPHVNPDGEARNRAWIDAWSDDPARRSETLSAYLRGRRRELPGRDLEFGYPEMRVENEAASAFLFGAGPVALHASLHGMGYSEGALLMIQKDWIEREVTGSLRDGFAAAARAAGFRLHDHDRGGEKGFHYHGPGFWTTPEGRAMRAHFDASGDPETAAHFHASSMEAARATGPDPALGARALCVVTELPLFVLTADAERVPGVPVVLRRFQERSAALAAAAAEGESLEPWIDPLGLRPVPLATAVQLHLQTLDLALGVVA